MDVEDVDEDVDTDHDGDGAWVTDSAASNTKTVAATDVTCN